MTCRSGRPLFLVGFMGCGKTTLGKVLSRRLNLPFIDSDKEIEKASGCSISDLFATYGEEEFRRGEERIMARLLTESKPCVLSSGGGAFLSLKTHRQKTCNIRLDSRGCRFIKPSDRRTQTPAACAGKRQQKSY